MIINYIDAKANSIESLKEEVHKNQDNASIIYNIQPDDLESLATQLSHDSERKIFTQFTSRTVESGDIFLVDYNQEINCNGIQITKKYKTENSSNEVKLSKESTLNDTLLEELSLATKAEKMGVWSYNVETGAILWDEKMLEIHKINSFDGQFETYRNLIHEKDRDEAVNSIFRYIEDESILDYSVEYRVDAGDEELYVKGMASIERENGKAIKITGVVWDITEEKESERLLKEQNEKLAQFEKFIDQSSDAIQVSDENGKLIYINSAGSKRLGINFENVSDYHVWDFEKKFKEDLTWEDHINDLKSKGDLTLESINFNQKTKEPFPVEVRVTYQKIHGKGYVIANSRDITERKRNEIALRESEEILRNVADSIPGAVYRYSIKPDGTDVIDYVSKASENIWELPIEQLRNNMRPLWEMIHPEDLPGVKKSVEESSKNLSPWKYEYRIIVSNGRIKWLSAAGQPKKLKDGTILWHSIALDVTEKKNAEIQLEKTLDQLNLSIDTGKMGIWELNVKDGSFDWNHQMFEIYGVEESEFNNNVETFNKLVHPDDVAITNDAINQLANGNKLKDIQFRIIRPDGQTRHILVSGKPSYYNENGELEKSIGTNIDVTQIAEYQEKLKETLNEKETLFKELHHRIKNNLQMVSSLLFVKTTMTEDLKLRGFINETSTKIQSISSIYEQLLQMQGVNELDIKDYLASLCQTLVKTYSYGNTQFELVTDLDSAIIDIDKVLNLGLIVNEIISNTMKYAYPERGYGKIYVSLKHKNNQSALVVSDDGIGIPNEKISDMEGSYGMQLISLFTEQLSGKLDVDNSSGTKFTIKF